VDSRDALTPLQQRLLELLAPIEPAWTLVGGGALVGYHLGHRSTRDLDLFWRGLDELGPLAAEIERRLRGASLDVAALQRAPTFVRLRVSDEDEVIVLDLAIDTGPELAPDELVPAGGAQIRVASRRAILVNKLCALLGRQELRDLIDVKALLERGESLEQALRDAPTVDGGFSPLTLAWVLRGLDPSRLAAAAGLAPELVDDLTEFRDELVERLLALARPEE
jgi:hypothetical protein